jgi:hypothetical protein
MTKNIKMGNDEFILYVRKQNLTCKLKNDRLGRTIWEWIRDNADGKQIGKRKGCEWGEEADNVDADKLPYTATQFEFDREKLPELYDFLDSL